MKQLFTEIEISAPIDKIWELLTNFNSYPDWNPFIRQITGEIKVGKRFEVTLQQPDSTPMKFTPKCLALEENKEFRWLGHLFIKGLFDGEHIFELIELENGKVRFIQRENFKGILVSLLWKQLDTNTRKGFELMNEKIKELAENKSS